MNIFFLIVLSAVALGGVIISARLFAIVKAKGRAGIQSDYLQSRVDRAEGALAAIDRETKALQWARWWARNAAECSPHDPMRLIGERIALVALLCDSTDEVEKALRLRAPHDSQTYKGPSERNSFWIAVHREELSASMLPDNRPTWELGPTGEPLHQVAALALRRRTLLDLE